MKIFLDTANVSLIEKYKVMGLVDGVTTNPSLLAKEGGDPVQHVISILKAVSGHVSIEVISEDYDGMIEEGRNIAKLGKNAVVKIPMTKNGIHAVKTLSEEWVKTNVTLVFSPAQALLAAKAGATYVSPFVGRLDDIGVSGIEVVKDI